MANEEQEAAQANPEAAKIDEAELFRQLGLLYNYADDDSRQFTRWQMVVAIRHGFSLSARTPSAGAGEGEAIALIRAEFAAEDARNQCDECGNEGPWEHCGPCSERIGSAINDRMLFIARIDGALSTQQHPDRESGELVDEVAAALDPAAFGLVAHRAKPSARSIEHRMKHARKKAATVINIVLHHLTENG